MFDSVPIKIEPYGPFDQNGPEYLPTGNYFIALHIPYLHRDSIEVSMLYEIIQIDN